MVEPLKRVAIDPEFYQQIHDVYLSVMKGDMAFKVALDKTDNIRADLRKTDNIPAMGYLATTLGILYGYQQDYKKSLAHFDQARRYYQNAGDEYRTVVTMLNLGETYRLQGNLTRARRMFHEASEMVAGREEWRLEANALANEGLIYIEQNNINNARTVFQNALNASHKQEATTDKFLENDWSTRSEMYYGLAQIDIIELAFNKAWDNAITALEYAEKSGMNIRLGQANRTIAQVISLLGHAPTDDFEDTPDPYFKKALEYFSKSELEVETAYTLVEQAQSFAKRGQTQAAYKCYTQAFTIFARKGLSKEAADTAEARAQLRRSNVTTDLLSNL
jgi:tetratricopeptide (TPR) repeat protein